MLTRASPALLALALLFATVAFGQSAAQPRVAIVLFSTPQNEPNSSALVAGLRELGRIDGRNVALEYRFAGGQPERLRELALETAASRPDVIVAFGGDVVPFVQQATRSIPIVMLTSNDPIETRMIASYAHPGGNTTGVAFVSVETGAKRLQYLHEAAPAVARVAVLWNPDHPDGEYRDVQAAARTLGMQVISLEVRRPEDFDPAFDAAVQARAEALMVVSSRLINVNRVRIYQWTVRQRIPLISGWGPWAESGGLLSYGPDLDVLARRAASQVDKILKGARPGELPVEQPTRFELVVNLRAAREVGIVVPPALIGRADRVVQ